MESKPGKERLNATLRKEWSPERVFVKIVLLIKRNIPNVNVYTLLRESRVLPGFRALTAATCFSSILKLKQARRIDVLKDPTTLEIVNITIADEEQVHHNIRS
ncbi:unnamed protein product [Spodoptera littoralis]|uniref:Uncharacterized protein n=1 Tax=Spodoptera littoralis TaxID=7109 RepID=A0A9P0IIS8_SPOLI|nr:unnamed protein product [Spodoptera littoralis]CAH1647808.1 unnamed protein product [Spodoptera littoralis]